MKYHLIKSKEKKLNLEEFNYKTLLKACICLNKIFVI